MSGKKTSTVKVRNRLLRYLKSKAYPVIPVSEINDQKEKETETKNVKDEFIDQLKSSIKDPCIFVHFSDKDKK